VDGDEVGHQRRLRPDGDDPSVLLPDRLEELADQPAALRRLWLGGPEALEVVEQPAGSVEVGIGRRVDALDRLLQRLASHDVLGLREVAHQVEIAQALQLREQPSPFAVVLVHVGPPGPSRIASMTLRRRSGSGRKACNQSISCSSSGSA
jgi:hypothetical protein